MWVCIADNTYLKDQAYSTKVYMMVAGGLIDFTSDISCKHERESCNKHDIRGTLVSITELLFHT